MLPVFSAHAAPTNQLAPKMLFWNTKISKIRIGNITTMTCILALVSLMTFQVGTAWADFGRDHAFASLKESDRFASWNDMAVPRRDFEMMS